LKNSNPADIAFIPGRKIRRPESDGIWGHLHLWPRRKSMNGRFNSLSGGAEVEIAVEPAHSNAKFFYSVRDLSLLHFLRFYDRKAFLEGSPAMRIKEIVFEQWPPFFDDFTYLHQGERVNIETLSGSLGVTSHVRDLPLVGIVAADPRAGAGEWIEIIAGDSAQTHATHSIPRPAHVHLAEEENGTAVALQIESARGMITIVRFSHASEGMPPGFTVA
jgi:hypothetical protein